ncbi:glycosyltransferase family 2 protein [Candidatus Methylacidithermus pantelleriae]|uniref:Glyco_trans_2-like domain-containing protein n=1 Tax=Candidatus Methylacidithermus pantelleriae TaxID=2744239 RepID=A0A8J2FMP8_9BACT|nr:glycosyltransferase family 2 protein [Candidatus Methylacidithermus pantelleriae]CAF0689544.1 Glyco_trans_2-like domain-containing protein [Candidatus Methylacidithermus pantelleriae]
MENYAIIIPTYNLFPMLRRCLESLATTTRTMPPKEILVIDDGSTDQTRPWLMQQGPPLRVLSHARPQGFAKSSNEGAAEAQSPVLIFLNNDVEALANWVEPLLDVLWSYPDVGFVGNAQWNPKTRRWDHLGVVFSPEGLPTHMGKGFRWNPFRGVRTWRAVTAACCAIRREVFWEAGGFDTSFRNGWEDMDLCLRLGRKGYRHYVAYESKVHHWVSSSPGRTACEKQNQDLFLQRWQGSLKQELGASELRLWAINYLGRYCDRPWAYNGWKLGKAFRVLLRGS